MVLTHFKSKSERTMFKRLTLVGVTSYGPVECNKKKYFIMFKQLFGLCFQRTFLLFSVAGVYAKVTKVMKWIIPNIQDGECAKRKKSTRGSRSMTLKSRSGDKRKSQPFPPQTKKAYRNMMLKYGKRD